MSEFMPKINLIDREFVVTELKEVAGRFGRFLLQTPEVHPYMSEHYRGAEEMLATVQPTLFEQIESD